ncbi:MAG: DUF3124 domain-containing protein [Planctomycetota bacterium]
MTPAEAEASVRRMKILAAGFVGLFLLPLLLYAIYLDGRIESLKYFPPEALEVEHAGREDLQQLPVDPVEGQVVYVPAYSHVYHGTGTPYQLTITLSVRNTSAEHGIVVQSIRYFDTQGKLVKSHLPQPVRLPPLGTTEVLVERDDTSGGSGANFLVEWHAKTAVTAPVIEAVMISANAGQGISFVRQGRPLSVAVPHAEATPDEAPPADVR